MQERVMGGHPPTAAALSSECCRGFQPPQQMVCAVVVLVGTTACAPRGKARASGGKHTLGEGENLFL